MAKEPTHRYPDARAMVEDLTDTLVGRPPRHRAGWTPPARSDTVPLTTSEDALADLEAELRAAASAPPTADLSREGALGPVAPAPTVKASRLSRRFRAAAVAILFALAITAIGYSSLRRLPASAPPATAARPATLGSAPVAPAAPIGEVARLAVDFEHSLKAGRLRVWVDDDLRLDHPLESEVSRRLLALKTRRGNVGEMLELTPGRHDLRLQVTWDGETRSQRLQATFLPRESRRLAARLGGLLKKNLSLEWR
jgi:hypothetical protein